MTFSLRPRGAGRGTQTTVVGVNPTQKIPDRLIGENLAESRRELWFSRIFVVR
jgi:hypothetical protein